MMLSLATITKPIGHVFDCKTMIEHMYDYRPEGAHLTITHPLPYGLTTITTQIGQLTVTITSPEPHPAPKQANPSNPG